MSHSRRLKQFSKSYRLLCLFNLLCGSNFAFAQAPKITPAETPAPVVQAPSHDRLKQCAAEWQMKKKNGTDTGQTWRGFSEECFRRK